MKALPLIIALIHLLFIAQAQLCEKAPCDQLKDYCNARITNAYIKEYLAIKNKQDSGNYEKIRVRIFSEITIRNHPDYQTMAEALTPDFKKTKEKLTDRINAIVLGNLDVLSADNSSKIFIHKIDSTISSDIKGQIENYTVLKSELEEELANYFTRVIPDNEQVVEATPPPVIIEQSHPDESPTLAWLSFRGFNFWIALLSLLNVILLCFTGYTYRLAKRAQSRKSNHSDDRNSERDLYHSDNIGKLKSEINTKLTYLESKVNAIDDRLNQKITEPIKADGNESVLSTLPNVSNIFYMSFPVGNYFSNKSRSNSKPDTFYTFEPDSNNPKEASFEIHASEAMIKEFVSMSEECIKPACQEKNIASPSVKKIITEKAGFAVLEDDKWIIKTKAIIRYE